MRKLLSFLNLLDSSGNLSISNVAVIVCITKMALSHQLSGMEVGALLTTMLNYAHKRIVNNGSQDAN